MQKKRGVPTAIPMEIPLIGGGSPKVGHLPPQDRPETKEQTSGVSFRKVGNGYICQTEVMVTSPDPTGKYVPVAGPIVETTVYAKKDDLEAFLVTVLDKL